MANENKQESTKAEPKMLQLSVEDIHNLVNAAVSSATGNNTEAQMKMMVEMLAELKKPYVDPNKAAIDEQFRKIDMETEARKQANILAAQTTCPHLEGSNPLSDEAGTKSSIIKHVLDNGVMFGICTNCQKTWFPETPGYAVELNRKSINRVSKSGNRYGTAATSVR